MRTFFIFILLSFIVQLSYSQDGKEFTNSTFLKRLNKDRSYSDLKKKIVLEFAHVPSGNWGEFVSGVKEIILTQKKIIAFTFDACGGKNGNGYDKDLVDYLRNQKIPATLFISGKWIDSQFPVLLNLSQDTLFEIENHGLYHKPCSIEKDSVFGIKGTSNIEEAFDEIEGNARKIEAIIHYRPHFFRSATAYMDEACAHLANRLGITPVSYQILSGDATPHTSATVIRENVIKKIKPGAIVIMHFNHPEWNTFEAMEKIIPELRQMGYKFVRLKDFELESSRKNK
jgi:peptidoglycan/xylan/chitin deacetylase (PgdA/CDA1 family)